MVAEDVQMSQPWVSELAQTLGCEMVSVEKGRSEYRLQVSELHANKGGTIHGGMYSMLCDMALGAALVSTLRVEDWCATAQLSISFLEAASVGSLLTATGRIVRRGRNVAHCAGEVVDQHGRTVATATGTWAIWTKK